MKSLIQLLFFGAISILSLSCSSSLKIRVDALNMPAFKSTYLYNVEDLAKKKNAINNIISKSYLKDLDKAFNHILTYLDTSGIPAKTTIQTIKNTFKKQKSDMEAGLEALSLAALQSVTEFQKTTNDTTLQSFEIQYAALKAGLGKLKDLINDLNEVDETLGLTFPESIIIENLNAEKAYERLQSAFGETIIDDPFSSIIAVLPEQYWSKNKKAVNLSLSAGVLNQKTIGDINNYAKKAANRVNTTFAKTFLGNSDIAIKMTTPGEFIVKGVRVDADEAIRNSFKIVAQGIKYMAYLSGAPIVDKNSGTNKSLFPFIDSLQQTQANYQHAKDKYSRATDIFLQAVIDYGPDLDAANGREGMSIAQLKTIALERIKLAYTLYKKTLAE